MIGDLNKGIGSIRTVEFVGTFTSNQQVITWASCEGILSMLAIKKVITSSPGQTVSTFTSEENICSGTTQDSVLSTSSIGMQAVQCSFGKIFSTEGFEVDDIIAPQSGDMNFFYML